MRCSCHSHSHKWYLDTIQVGMFLSPPYCCYYPSLDGKLRNAWKHLSTNYGGLSHRYVFVCQSHDVMYLKKPKEGTSLKSMIAAPVEAPTSSGADRCCSPALSLLRKMGRTRLAFSHDLCVRLSQREDFVSYREQTPNIIIRWRRRWEDSAPFIPIAAGHATVNILVEAGKAALTT